MSGATPPKRFTLARVLGEALLSILAVGGLACIVLFILALTLNVSVIMFKTGSMAPTIPAGSAALVREIPAAEIEVGDVVTVDRPGELPVTHRVTSVEAEGEGEGEGATRTITMRGDANEVDDPEPYSVSEVRVVLGSVPALAHVIVWFSNPWVLGGLTIGAAGLVTWAFWPRTPRTDVVQDGDDEPRDPPRPGPRRAIRVAGGTTASIALAGAAILALPAAEAHAEPETKVSDGEVITLTSIGDPEAMRSMKPGVPAHWHVGITADAPDPGEISIAAGAAADSTLDLNLVFRVCTMKWVEDACAGSEVEIAEVAELPAGNSTPIFTMPADEERWLLVTATLPESSSGSTTLTVHASGMGDEASITPGGPVTSLPRTGADVGWMLWLALGALATGAVVSRLSAHRYRRVQR